MKRIVIILLLAAAVPLTATPQKKTDFQSFYDRYNGKEHFTTIEIGSEMLKLLGNSGPAQTNENHTFDGIDRIRIVISERADPSFIEEIKNLPGEDFKPMTTINEGGQRVSFYLREDAKYGHKSEFLMIVSGDKDNLALSITGEIDLKNISGLSGIRITGMDKLENQK